LLTEADIVHIEFLVFAARRLFLQPSWRAPCVRLAAIAGEHFKQNGTAMITSR